MTRKLDYTISETVYIRSKSRIHIPKKYASYIGLKKGYVAHVTNLNGAYIITVCPTPESKKFMVDKDGAVRFNVSWSSSFTEVRLRSAWRHRFSPSEIRPEFI
jgi:hypothetical protein